MTTRFLIAVLATTLLATVKAQSPEPKPAFAGQTDQPSPSMPSPPLNVETITTRLNGPW
jgi:hypothetical protein